MFPRSEGGQAAVQHVDADAVGAYGPPRGDYLHGFRSTFSDWASEVSPFSSEFANRACHTIGNKAEAAYRRGDALEKRRAMMEDGGMVRAKSCKRGGIRQARTSIGKTRHCP